MSYEKFGEGPGTNDHTSVNLQAVDDDKSANLKDVHIKVDKDSDEGAATLKIYPAEKKEGIQYIDDPSMNIENLNLLESLQKNFKWLIEHPVFRIILMLMILTDFTLVMIDLAKSSCSSNDGLENTSHVIISLFLLEVLARLFYQGREFFRSIVDIVDGAVVVVSFIVDMVFVGLADTSSCKSNYARLLVIGRVFRVIRILRILYIMVQQRRHVATASRRVVSQNKRRYQKDGFDLDLCYITVLYFSRFSTWLKRYAAITLHHLMEAFEKCYTPRPVAIQTSHVFNITGWIENCIEKIEGHSKPHCFKITKNGNGKTKLYYKNWSTDKVWIDATENFQLLKEMPTGTPQHIQPVCDDVDLSRVQESVEKCINKQFISREEDISWWRNFFTNINSEEMIHTDETWPIPEILRNKIQTSEAVEEHIDEVTGDVDPVVVTVGKKKKTNNGNQEIQVGTFVLANVPKYAGEWPQLGMIQAVRSNTATIHWYKGSKTTSWTPCTKPIQGQKGKREDWLEEIDKSFIIKPIKLTPSGHLPKKLKDDLEMMEH